MPNATNFQSLIAYLTKIPGVVEPVGSGTGAESWWVKFAIDIGHPLLGA
jgi:hypothetical protein